MRTATLLTTLFAASTFAFNVTLHENTYCEGTLKVYEDIKVEDGCQKVEAVNSQSGGITVQWTDKKDNDLSVAFFDNDNCCNGGPEGSRGWGVDDCTSMNTAASFRVMDPSDINKGKEGENYECRENPDDDPPPEDEDEDEEKDE